MHRLPRTLLVTLCAVALTQACAGPAKPAAPPSSTSSATAASPQPAGASPQPGGQSNGQSYTVGTTPLNGTTEDKVGTWEAQAGQLSGGDQRVTDAFNAASRSSVQGLIDQAKPEGNIAGDMPPGWTWEMTVKSSVSFQPLAISQVSIGVYYGQHAAHPIDFVATVVIDSRDAQPITLSRLFTNEQVGLNRLSAELKTLMNLGDQDGNKPVEKNFANWIPTDKGMELHLADYQFGHGLPVETVPWAALADVLAPNMRALAHG